MSTRENIRLIARAPCYFICLTGVVLSNLQVVDLGSSRNLAIIGTSIFTGLMVPHWIETYPSELSTGKMYK